MKREKDQKEGEVQRLQAEEHRWREEVSDKDEQLRLREAELVSMKREKDQKEGEVQRLQAEMKEEVEAQQRALELQRSTSYQATVDVAPPLFSKG